MSLIALAYGYNAMVIAGLPRCQLLNFLSGPVLSLAVAAGVAAVYAAIRMLRNS